MSDKRYRCGYVGVPETHAIYGAWARNDFLGQKPLDRFKVFNGITYSGNSDGGFMIEGDCHTEAPTDPAYWWFGFDCSKQSRTLLFVTGECAALSLALATLDAAIDAIQKDSLRTERIAAWRKNEVAK